MYLTDPIADMLSLIHIWLLKQEKVILTKEALAVVEEVLG